MSALVLTWPAAPRAVETGLLLAAALLRQLLVQAPLVPASMRHLAR
jgi:hypothetical protein